MTVVANISLGFTLEETFSATESPAQAAGSKLLYSAYNRNFVLNSTSTPALNVQPVDLSKTMASASESLDLTAIPWLGDQDINIDMTGKKMLGLLLRATETNNAGGVIVRAHGTDGYDLFGSGHSVLLRPGMGVAFCFETVSVSPLDAVATADKIIEYSGTVNDVITGLGIFQS